MIASVDGAPAPPESDVLAGSAAIVLAAGKGTRMRSSRHKVLHRLAGKTMIWHVLNALASAGIPAERTIVVIGESGDDVRREVEAEFGAGQYPFVWQEHPLGTGHATLAAREAVPVGAQTLLVAYGDTPLLQPATILRLLDLHRHGGAAVTLVTGEMHDPGTYGRIVRGADGAIKAVVEARDATAEQRQLGEVNSGFCAFQAGWLWETLPAVPRAANGEIYLTALAGLAAAGRRPVSTLVMDDITETVGVNTRRQLADAEQRLRQRVTDQLMDSGVTVQDPASTYVDAGVRCGPDTVILANTHLQGATVIGSDCTIGPNAIIRDSVVGDRCRVLASVMDRSALEDDVTVGPFAHLRPGTRCGRAASVGTGSELKGSYLGPGSRMHHFGYLGDATVGADVNIGAGTVTCNFDGERKHPTHIADGAFIGSGSLLVAPVTVGSGALTGAGAVVLHDVAPDEKVAGVPARSIGLRVRQQPVL